MNRAIFVEIPSVMESDIKCSSYLLDLDYKQNLKWKRWKCVYTTGFPVYDGATSFPGSLTFPPSLTPREGGRMMRYPGNEVYFGDVSQFLSEQGMTLDYGTASFILALKDLKSWTQFYTSIFIWGTHIYTATLCRLSFPQEDFQRH